MLRNAILLDDSGIRVSRILNDPDGMIAQLSVLGDHDAVVTNLSVDEARKISDWLRERIAEVEGDGL
jgi:hypothetical protein